ncbi:hypothetical protein [Nitrosopumilus piranensis]|uniref:hypothetical protein n=1 Tax=Nitrosopumilus piranensis TaxID=1582439 RepID=UPI0011E5E776|nr:hypothetical protein [Nitrosopumilus piranensis]
MYIPNKIIKMINVFFFEISNANNLFNSYEIGLGNLFLKYKNSRPKIIIFEIIITPDHTPISYGFGVTDSIPGISIVFDSGIKAGNITETKLIKTMLIENTNTVQMMILLF